MGLDMYLDRKIYIGAHYDFNKITGTIDLKADGVPIPVDLSKVNTISLREGYWRKANAIHKWFVDNTQDGKDECNESYVGWSQLQELKELCIKAIEEKDSSVLEPQSGFFFGSTDRDEYYYEDLKYTIDLINNLDPKGEYYYQASW